MFPQFILRLATVKKPAAANLHYRSEDQRQSSIHQSLSTVKPDDETKNRYSQVQHFRHYLLWSDENGREGALPDAPARRTGKSMTTRATTVRQANR
jgi:hypothetical protein